MTDRLLMFSLVVAFLVSGCSGYWVEAGEEVVEAYLQKHLPDHVRMLLAMLCPPKRRLKVENAVSAIHRRP